jgi:flagellar basal body P-ring formation protein FlgA
MLRVMLLLTLALPAEAETLVAARTLRAHTVLSFEDVRTIAGNTPGALTDPAAALGWETRVTLYAGRPIRAADLGPPALVDRNQLVVLTYMRNGLAIATDGRALERGGMGDRSV